MDVLSSFSLALFLDTFLRMKQLNHLADGYFVSTDLNN